MSAPPRGPHGGGRSNPIFGSRGRATGRGTPSSRFTTSRGRGRGAAPATTNSRAEGLLQGQQAGNTFTRAASSTMGNGRGTKRTVSLQRRAVETSCARANAAAARNSNPVQFNPTACLPTQGRTTTPRGPTRGARGRGAFSQTFGNPSATPPRPPSPLPFSSNATNDVESRFQQLKQQRESERARAIRDGFLADPDKKTTLDKAITPVGTCTEMCPEFERVERMRQKMIERAERTPNENGGRGEADESRMVKRFRRSAAGYDEQLPSDIRTPATLQKTLNYLLDELVAGEEKLVTIHKFVWDRTRGIRNDFSIQQVTKEGDVKIAVDCFERIGRFHILSLHQLSNLDNLAGGEFDAHQEREQLNNTLLSLMYYYEDNRVKQDFPNEPEFRAYCILFELQSQHPDLEDRMQSWPQHLLNDKRIQTAFTLVSQASNTLIDQGPLKPSTPFSIGQSNYGQFWSLLKSNAVSYLMACIAEIYFGQIRYMALQTLWQSHRGAAQQQTRNQEWTLDQLAEALAFDTEEEAFDFCSAYDLGFKENEHGQHFLDYTSQNMMLDQSSTPTKQAFSYHIVEAKRCRRTLVAVINGVSVARAIREGLVEAAPSEDNEEMHDDSNDALFFPEKQAKTPKAQPAFNPQASTFNSILSTTPQRKPPSTGMFGQPSTFGGFGTPSCSAASTFGGFGQPSTTSSHAMEQKITTPTTFTGFGQPSAITAPPTAQTSAASPSFPGFGQPFIFGHPTTTTASAAEQRPLVFTSSPGFGQPFTFGQPSTTIASTPEQKPSAFTSSPGFGQPFAFGQPTTTIASASEEKQAPTTPLSGFSFSQPSTTPTLPTNPVQQTSNAYLGFSAAQQPPKPFGGFNFGQTSSTKAPSVAMSPTSMFGEGTSTPSTLRAFAPPATTSSFLGQTSSSDHPGATPHFEPLSQQADESTPPPDTPFLPPSEPRPISGDLRPVPSLAEPPLAAPKSPRPAHRELPKSTQPPPSPLLKPLDVTKDDERRLDTTSQWDSNGPIPPMSRPQSSPWDATSHVDTTSLPPSSTPPASPKSATLSIPKSIPAAQKPIQDRNRHRHDDPKPKYRSPLATAAVITPESLQTTPLVKPPLSDAERDQAAEILASLGLLQRGGLFEQFLRFEVEQEMRIIVQKHEADKPVQEAKKIRAQLLSKKYFARWKAVAWRKSLNRRGRARRERISQTLRWEREKREQEEAEAELQAILQASEESDRLREEIARRSVENHQTKPATIPFRDTSKVHGQKRKSMHVERSTRTVSGELPRKIVKGHKRATTMGPIHAGHSTAAPGSRSVLDETQNLQRSVPGKRDKTRTDYFALKARGIDPDTPIVPETSKSLLQKQQTQELQEKGANSSTRQFVCSPITKPPVPFFSPPPSTTNGGAHGMAPLPPPMPTGKVALPSSKRKLDDDDDLLRQVREVRKALEEDTKWFREETIQLEKEVAQQEEFKRSQSRASSSDSPRVSVNGLARSANGYEYLPAPSAPGQSLSRTEERIQRTGAHGLATRYGASSRPSSSEYLAVPMSKQSAAALLKSQQAKSQPVRSMESRRKGKGKAVQRDGRYMPNGDGESEDSPEYEEESQHRAAGPRHLAKVSTSSQQSANDDENLAAKALQGFQNQQQHPAFDLEEEESEGDPEDYYGGVDGDTEELEEEDEDEAEEEDELDDLPDQQDIAEKSLGLKGGHWLRSSASPDPERLTPAVLGGVQMSRGNSGTGTGTSVNDAVMLDSD